MRPNRFVPFTLMLVMLGCAPSASSSSLSAITFEHEGYKIGDSVSSELLKRATPQPDGSVAIAIETKNLPHFKQTLLFLLGNKISEIGFDFSKEHVDEVYAYNDKKFGKPEGSNDKLWIWKLQEGGVYVLNREGWGKATSEKMLKLREKKQGHLKQINSARAPVNPAQTFLLNGNFNLMVNTKREKETFPS